MDDKESEEWYKRMKKNLPAFIEKVKKLLDDGFIKFDDKGKVIPPNYDNDPKEE